jgi:SAM-dependent methyltransferase
MTTQKNCPICLSDNVQKLIYYHEFPYFTTPISKTDKLKILKKYSQDQLTFPLKVSICSICYHSYLELIPEQSTIDFLYSNFYHYPSPLKGRFKPERDDQFIQFFEEQVSLLCDDKKLTSVLEVGCFDGYILYHLQKKGFKVTGCDPSEGALIGQEKGLNILQEFFDGEKFLKQDMTFDIVISRHFIEHVIDPRQWVSQLKKVLNPGGVLIIETPNALYHLERGLIEGFSLQHLQGFSSESLKYALGCEDFVPTVMENNSQNLIVLAEQRKSQIPDVISEWSFSAQKFSQKLDNNIILIQQTLLEFVKKKLVISMWGAGGFGQAAITLYNIPKESINFIIDSDPQKWKLHYIDNSIPIISPEEAKKMEPDLIIITSMYSNNINSMILEMDFKASKLIIFPEVIYEANLC